jgi:GNAT superfamily N-acetyltransferase
MPTIGFVAARFDLHRDALVRLNLEYVDWVLAETEREFGVAPADLLGRSVSDYVEATIAKLCEETPPRGSFYLVEVDGAVAGMGGLRFLQDGVGEIKRIYVRPDYRGAALGDRILERLLEDARRFGYRSARLDSGPFMRSAHRVYERAGFQDRPAYEGAEVPAVLHANWRFMERLL